MSDLHPWDWPEERFHPDVRRDVAEALAKQHADNWHAQQMEELRRDNAALARRVVALERRTNPDGGALVKALVEVLSPIVDRVKAIEARPALHYAGVWDEGSRYAKGAAVTAGGSLWIALEDCALGERPGKAVGWRLAVKNGEAKGPVVA